MKLRKILGVGILATGILFSGCFDETAENSAAAVQVANEKFPQFSTVNLANETVTNEIFAQKKITVINIWGTFCPPCIDEMPELGKWAKDMPADAQIIGIVCDVNGVEDSQTIEAAKQILRESNANFVNLVPNAEIAKYLEKCDAVPTTIFVDSQGNILGEPIVGANIDIDKKVVGENVETYKRANIEVHKQRVAEYLK